MGRALMRSEKYFEESTIAGNNKEILTSLSSFSEDIQQVDSPIKGLVPFKTHNLTDVEILAAKIAHDLRNPLSVMRIVIHNS